LARLLKTEREVEGRVEEAWLVVEEDALDQWPEGPLAVVGRPAARMDGPERARGEARYTADVRLPGMLHAAVLRSAHAYAVATRVDFAKALLAPGVRGVLAPGECPELEREAGYFGAPVAAVAAETFGQAQAALDLVEVEWDVREPLLDPDEAVARGELHGKPRRYARGDVDAALADADVVIEAEYRTQTLLHNALETHQAVCEWEGDRLTVYTSTQYIWEVRAQIADALEMPRDKVRVICRFMGGGFGAKNNAADYAYVAAVLARRTGRPVRCALTRREENLGAGNRNATIQRLTAAARADGTLVALRGEYVCALGWGGWLPSVAGPMQMLYGCENVETVEYAARVNTSPMDAFRAPGFVEGVWGLEGLLDEVASKLGLDPLEVRIRNHADTDPKDGRPFSAKNLMECYRRAEPHWERRHEVRERSDGPWRRGVGLASQIWFGSAAPPSYAQVLVEASGRATVVTGMQDIGTGTRTVMAQIAAEELGLPLDRVEVELGDSSRGGYAVPSGGSSTTPTMGPAVRSAAADAKRQLLEIAAQRFELEERALSIQDGKIVSAHGGSWPLTDLTELFEHAQVLGKGACGPNPTGMRVLTFGVHVAEVAVDVETGEVRVERVFAVHDVGRIINPLGASSQVEGGIIQGIGHTLSEQRLLDPASGAVLTQTLDAYKVPTMADVPEIVCDFVDRPDSHLTNLGSKGLGEPPIVPIAPAIANAIRDATGAEVRSLPVTREEVLAALRNRDRALAGQPA
jgi:CO/xanthine dehydrogenase Mo-binding subunit